MATCPPCNPCNCPDPDFLERNGTWVLSFSAIVFTCIGGMFTYMLKSRCKKIQCLGMSCDRDVVALDPGEVTIETSTKT